MFRRHGPGLGSQISLSLPWSRVEEDSLPYQHILPESPEPAASHALSDGEMSEKSSSSQDQKQDSESERTSVLVNNFSQGKLSFTKHFKHSQGFLV